MNVRPILARCVRAFERELRLFHTNWWFLVGALLGLVIGIVKNC